MNDAQPPPLLTSPAVFLIGPRENIVSWNAGCEHLLGYPAGELVSKKFSSVLTEAASVQWRQWRAQQNTDPVASAYPAPTRDSLVQSSAQYPPSLELDLLRADRRRISCRVSVEAQYGKSGRLRYSTVILIPSAFGREDGLADPTLPPQTARTGAARDSPEEEARAVGEVPLNHMLELIAGPFSITDENNRYLLWNKHAENVTQRTPEEMRNTWLQDVVSVRDWPAVEQYLRHVLATGEVASSEISLVSKYGEEKPFLVSSSRLSWQDKKYICAMALDMSMVRSQQETLRVRERALHAAGNGIAITRCAEGDFFPLEYVNPAYERITGYSEAEVLGRDARLLQVPGIDDEQQALLESAIEQHRSFNQVYRNRRKDGTLFWNDLSITPVRDDKGVVTHYIGILNDVTESRQRTELLEYEVNHDALTGLANRTLLWDRLDQALHTARRNKSFVATVLLDLNGFKDINDTLGHDVGDQVLKAVAKRLQSSVRDSDTVARLSGDEFVLVLTNQPSLRFLTRMVDRVRSAMAKPVSYDSREGTVGAAIGVSVFPHDGATPFELVRAADVAMYHSKEAGRSEAHFFSAEMKSSTEARRKLELNMRTALENDEIFLLFQPRVSMDTSKLTGIEALLRWRHPEQGVLQPSAFLAEAEENGMIVALGNRVLDLVCGFTLRLKELGYSALPVSMNASFREFSQKNYIEGVAARLGANKLSVGDVELELLEAQLVRDMRIGRQVVAELVRWGVALTLDHFCENMSNLNFARELPLRSVKLARSAIAEIGTDGGLLARTVIELGHNLQARVIAEGVETQAEYDFLRANGCDELQGNYYCEPLDQAALEVLLSQPGGADRQWQPAH